MMDKEKIDFVIIWVDGNDPEWQKEKECMIKVMIKEIIPM